MADRGPTGVFIFVRADTFYFLELPLSDDLGAHAEANPGTLRIEDTDGRILWRGDQ